MHHLWRLAERALLAIVALTIVIAALLIVMVKRDTKHGTSGSLSSAMLHVHSLFQPEKERMVESIRGEREDEGDASGDPPQR